MPNTIGALDGKHIAMDRRRKDGSLFFNCKKFHSIVLLALVDADYNFQVVDIGGFRHENDAKILDESVIGKGFNEGLSLIFPT